MPALNLLIKPASSLCNMGCKYCFYRNVAHNRNTKSFGIMSEEVIDAMIKNVFSYATEAVSFAFQGGEPTLAGDDFYIAFHKAVEKYNTRKIPTAFSLQTNGYAVSDFMIELFKKHRYLIGVSLDGDKVLHDSLRTTLSDGPTYDVINDTISRFDKAGIDYNILTVITEDVAKRGAEVYKHLRDRGFKFLQFIPYVPDFGNENESESYTLTNEKYAYFLNETFREYHKDFINGSYVSVRQFDNFVRIAAGLNPECCGMGGRCYANLVAEADGSVYPCDFYVLDKWKMGNITKNSISELLSSEQARRFVSESFSVSEECKKCPYLSICRGGCRRHKDNPGGSLTLNRYCDAYKEFFKSSIALIADIARRLCKK